VIQEPLRGEASAIPLQILKEYRDFAGISPDAPLCKAPFISMRFNRTGGVTPCCQNYHLDSIMGKGLLEVWKGEAYRTLRRKILDNDLDGQCDFCKTNLLNSDYGNVLASFYDSFEIQDKGYPVYLDFSIDNKCNLRCIMCNGSLSSAHNLAGEKLTAPPIYDEHFLNELETLIPHLEFAIFSGGEPFIIESYYRIWERIFVLNPKLNIVITTNAAILSDRAKEIIERGRCSFNVSIDSLDPQVYESIRVNAGFAKIFENLHYLIDYSRRKGTNLTLAACPMNMNWQTLPELVTFCIREKLNLYFNLVTKPWKVALWALSEKKLREIAGFLQDHLPPQANGVQTDQWLQVQILIQQCLTWANQSGYFQQHPDEFLVPVDEFISTISDYISGDAAFRGSDENDKTKVQIKMDEVLRLLPVAFFTDFFLERLLRIPASRLFSEILNEQCETTADNLCSIYYYARGEKYTQRSFTSQ